MDMKKKLDETYMPDREGRKKKIVVGLSGGLNSFVTAYLLKIQKYELIGVTIMTNWENFPGDASSVLACQMEQPQVESIREFCHQIGIPHFVVKASDEFKEDVVEKWVGNRITGTRSSPCWNCHELRMRLLHQKMVELEALGLATGHLGKIFRQDSHQSVYVHTSNDEQSDQSGILSRLPHEILDKLMLPLSDLQQKEIGKLAENFGLTALSKKVKMHDCFQDTALLRPYLEATVPASYLKVGEILDLEKEFVIEHQGIQYYKNGEIMPVPNQRQNDPLYFGKFSYSDKKIELVRTDYFQKQKLFITNCKISEETPWGEPLKGIVKVSETEFADCWIFPKNASGAVIEFEAPQAFFEGDVVTVLKKRGKNSKVYFTGMARYIPEEKTIIEEGKERAKADYTRDF